MKLAMSWACRMSCARVFVLAAGCTTIVLAQSGAEAKDPSAAIDAYLRAEMEQAHVPGTSIAVVHKGRLVFARGYGLANVELAVSAAPETVYELLSVGKEFCASAVMLLAEDGKLSIDEKLATYLSDVPPAWSDVTVRQLLSHTSGIPDYTEMSGWFATIRLDRTPKDLIDTVASQPLEFTPGTRWHYSNTNYYLLGLIVEKCSGKKYAAFLEERIFRPLAMTSTRMNDLSAIVAHRAAGYHWRNDALENAEPVSPTHKWAAGGVISTVLDLAKWEIALQEGKLLTAVDRERMCTPVVLANGDTAHYGFGNELDLVRDHRVAGHQGGGLAFNAAHVRFPDDGLAVILLCNQTRAPSQEWARHIAALYLPAIAFAADAHIKDGDPEATERFRQILLDAARGVADPEAFAPEKRDELVPFVRKAGPQFLGTLGDLQSLVLLEDRTDGAKHVRRYRSVYKTSSIVWTVEIAPSGRVLSLEPQPE